MAACTHHFYFNVTLVNFLLREKKWRGEVFIHLLELIIHKLSSPKIQKCRVGQEPI